MPKKKNPISDNTEVIDNLSISHPHLALEWHSTKNEPLRPHEVTCKSTRRVWWKCPQADDHEWEVRVTDRVRGPRCPFCIFFACLFQIVYLLSIRNLPYNGIRLKIKI